MNLYSIYKIKLIKYNIPNYQNKNNSHVLVMPIKPFCARMQSDLESRPSLGCLSYRKCSPRVNLSVPELPHKGFQKFPTNLKLFQVLNLTFLEANIAPSLVGPEILTALAGILNNKLFCWPIANIP